MQPVRPRTKSTQLAALVILTLLTIALTPGNAAATAHLTPDEAWMVTQTNQHRANAGVPPLRAVNDLTDAARAQSHKMARENLLHHTPNLGAVITGWWVVGENVGRGGTAPKIDTALMASPPHRANILDGRFTQVGIGIVEANGQLWVTQIFRKPDSTRINEPTVSAPLPLPEPTGGLDPTTCPESSVTWFKYADVDPRSVHRAAVDCNSWWGVIQGRTPTTYAPSEGLTRGQLATILARLLHRTGTAPSNAPDAFRDDDGHTHEAGINTLAAAGIVTGSSTGYRPNDPVTRAQGAAMLVRTIERAQGRSLPAGTKTFTDMHGHPLEAEVARAAAAGVVTGYSATTFGGGDHLRRDQGASLVVRAIKLLVHQQAITR